MSDSPQAPAAPLPQAKSSPPGSEHRRPYEPPRIVARETLESIAADCSAPGGKSDASCILGFS